MKTVRNSKIVTRKGSRAPGLSTQVGILNCHDPDISSSAKNHDRPREQLYPKTSRIDRDATTAAAMVTAIGIHRNRHDLRRAEALRARRYRMRKAGANIPKLKPGPKSA